MNKTDIKAFVFAAAIRAIKTFAQTALGVITVGAAFNEVDWIAVASIAGVAAVLSLLTSLTGGLPEVKNAEHSVGFDVVEIAKQIAVEAEAKKEK